MNKDTMKNYIYQIWVIYCLATLFLVSAIYAKVRDGQFQGYIDVYAILFLFVVVTAYLIKMNYFTLSFEISKEELMLLIVVCLPRIIQFNDLATDDSSIYYNYFLTACDQFDFTLKSLSLFNLVNHPTIGIAMFSAIGKFLIPYRLVGVNLVKLILVCFSAVMLYRIFQSILPKATKVRCLIYSLLVMNVPVYLGLFSYFTTEIGTSIFLIYVMYYFIERKYILFAFWSIMLLETKENALLVVGCLMGILFLYGFIENYRLEADQKKRRWYIVVLLIVIVLSGIAAFAFISSLKWNGGLESFFSGDKKGNSFYLDAEHINIKVKQLFCMSFNWLLWGTYIICGGLAYYNCRKKKISECIKHINVVIALHVVIWGQIAFQITYFTVETPRYDNVIIVVLGIVCCIFVELAISRKNVREIYTISIAILLGLQAFFACDPFMQFLFYRVETGGMTLYSPKEEQEKEYSFYNYQYSYKAKVIEKILKNTQYYGQDVFVLGDIRVPTFEGYWDIKDNKYTNTLSETAVPIQLHQDPIVIYKKLEEKIPSMRTTDDAIIIVHYPEYQSDSIMKRLYRLYDTVNEGKEVTDGLYGKMYYYEVYGIR